MSRLHHRVDGPAGAPVLVLANSIGTTHELWDPQIEAFVRRGGGLLVGGVGWSWRGNDSGVPYPGNVLGQSFGFRFTRDYFEADSLKPVPLSGGPARWFK